ncbi:MAG TPA: isocitrate lyase/PEP mutase family protein [Actinoplanes sp.]|jgi:methylisocitrate lyase
MTDRPDSGGSALRAILAADIVTHVPGVYDPVSAVLAVRAGHRAVLLSGAAISTTMLGRPDLTFTPATQIADRAAGLAPALGSVPILADADLGYDRPADAVWTALAYERSGIGGLLLDDDDHPGPAVLRITALASQVPQLAVVARVRGNGLAETMERCRAYAEAGADAVHPVGVDDPEHLGRIHAAFPGVPLVVTQPESADRRLTDADLAALGVRLVLHPLTAVLAALRAASLAYRAIAEEGNADRVDRLPWPAYTALLEPNVPGAPAGSASLLERIDDLDT